MTARATIRGRSRRAAGVTPAAFAKLAQAFPGAEPTTSHRIPVWKVKKKVFALYREQLGSVGLSIDFDQRDALIEAAPDTFHVTDHYRGHEFVLVRLAEVRRDELVQLLEQAWRRNAPAVLVAEYDGR